MVRQVVGAVYLLNEFTLFIIRYDDPYKLTISRWLCTFLSVKGYRIQHMASHMYSGVWDISLRAALLIQWAVQVGNGLVCQVTSSGWCLVIKWTLQFHFHLQPTGQRENFLTNVTPVQSSLAFRLIFRPLSSSFLGSFAFVFLLNASKQQKQHKAVWTAGMSIQLRS